MADNHSKEVRSMNMSHIRSTNSKPEEKVRKYLFARGLRYRKNDRRLPAELKIADMLSDTELLGQTQAVAKSILKEDFSLEKQEHRGLRGEVRLLLSTLRGA